MQQRACILIMHNLRVMFERCPWRRKNFRGSDPRTSIELILLQEELNDQNALDILIYCVCVCVCVCARARVCVLNTHIKYHILIKI